MRGKVWHGVALADGHRITPAYAGKSCIYRSTTSISWDHPRVCGEKSFKTSTSCWSKGSPPRMRGKGCACAQCASGGGITPAYAGKSPSQPYRLPDSQDHPRVCGEKTSSFISGAPIWGSPPRMRGKETCKKACEVSWGITPAYAGKRPLRCHLRSAVRDHPRVCGEKVNIGRDNNAPRGSPPRMRGKAFPGRLQGSFPGITPAYAGKRPGPQVRREGCQDHPRVCGEKYWRHSRFI